MCSVLCGYVFIFAVYLGVEFLGHLVIIRIGFEELPECSVVVAHGLSSCGACA